MSIHSLLDAMSKLACKLNLTECILEWQILRDTENTEKSQKLRAKWKTWKIIEKSIFMSQKKNSIQENLCSYDILR